MGEEMIDVSYNSESNSFRYCGFGSDDEVMMLEGKNSARDMLRQSGGICTKMEKIYKKAA